MSEETVQIAFQQAEATKYMVVIRELLQVIPSHLLPQGSPPVQLGGKFPHPFVRAIKAASAPKIGAVSSCRPNYLQ